MDKTQEIGQETIRAILKKPETKLVCAKFENRPRPIRNFRIEAIIPKEFETSFTLRKIAIDDIIKDAIFLSLKLNNFEEGLWVTSDFKAFFPRNLSIGKTFCSVCFLLENNQIKIKANAFQTSVIEKRSFILSQSPEGASLEKIL